MSDGFKAALLFLTVLVAPLAVGYVLALFVTWGGSFNPGWWAEETRFGIAIAWGIWAFIVGMFSISP